MFFHLTNLPRLRQAWQNNHFDGLLLLVDHNTAPSPLSSTASFQLRHYRCYCRVVLPPLPPPNDEGLYCRWLWWWYRSVLRSLQLPQLHPDKKKSWHPCFTAFSLDCLAFGRLDQFESQDNHYFDRLSGLNYLASRSLVNNNHIVHYQFHAREAKHGRIPHLMFFVHQIQCQVACCKALSDAYPFMPYTASSTPSASY